MQKAEHGFGLYCGVILTILGHTSMQGIYELRWASHCVVLALALGLSGCVTARNPFPLSAADGPSGPTPVALLPVGEEDVRADDAAATKKVARVTNRVLNTIASSKNNLIGPAEVLHGIVSAKRVVKTRVVHMPYEPDVSIRRWNLSVKSATEVRVEMKLLEGEPPLVIAEADVTESYRGYTHGFVVVPLFYRGTTLGAATDRAARRALVELFGTAETKAASKTASTGQ